MKNEKSEKRDMTRKRRSNPKYTLEGPISIAAGNRRNPNWKMSSSSLLLEMIEPDPSWPATSMLLEMIEDGRMGTEAVLAACLNYMSEAEIADMCNTNDELRVQGLWKDHTELHRGAEENLDIDLDGGLSAVNEGAHDEEDDGQPDEAQEWADYNPDC